MVRLTLRLLFLCFGFTLLLTSALLGLNRLRDPKTAFIVTYQCHYSIMQYQDYSLYRMTATGQPLQPFNLPIQNPTDLQWLSGNTWIILIGMADDGDWEIYRVRPDGADLQNLTHLPGEDTMPVLSPDEQWIVFASRREIFFNLYRMHPDGSHIEMLTDLEGHELRPVWSADSKWIAFQYLDDLYSWEIYRMESDGANLENLTFKTSSDSAPLWSLDSEWLYFTSNYNDDYGLYRMHSNGWQTAYLTPGLVDVKNVQWSPDGNWLVFEGKAQVDWDIYRMGGDGSDLQNLTQYDGTDTAPVWSPDGAWIYFSAYRDNRYDIYRMKADGSQLEKLPAPTCEAADRPSLSPLIDLGWRWWVNIGLGVVVTRLALRLTQVSTRIPLGLDQHTSRH